MKLRFITKSRFHILRFITRHIRGKPCTVIQLQISEARLVAVAALIGTVASVAAAVVLVIYGAILTLGGFAP